MKTWTTLLTVCLLLVVGSVATAAPISTLKNTGLFAAGAVDANWTVDNATAYVTDWWPASAGVWKVDDYGLGLSKWISPQASYRIPGQRPFTGDAGGDHLFSTTFEIPVGYNPASTFFTFNVMADNQVNSVWLNGNVLPGISYIDVVPPSGLPYQQWSQSFMVSSGFVAGTNTLSFVVNNFPKTDPDDVIGNPTGLRVEFGETNTDIDPIPEPASILLFGTGLIGAVRAARRRRS